MCRTMLLVVMQFHSAECGQSAAAARVCVPHPLIIVGGVVRRRRRGCMRDLAGSSFNIAARLTPEHLQW
jgi:hypothetical protein